MSNKRKQRYSVSVSADVYDRAQQVVNGSLARFVDTIVETALNDPAVLSRLVSRCRPRTSKEV
jgi:hypothetical protein